MSQFVLSGWLRVFCLICEANDKNGCYFIAKFLTMSIYYHSFSEIQLLFYKKLQIRLVFLDKVYIFTDKMILNYFNGIFFAYNLILSGYFTVCQTIFPAKNSVLLLLFLNSYFILAKIFGV